PPDSVQHRPDKGHLELQRGIALPRRQRRMDRTSHAGIEQRRRPAAMHRPQRIVIVEDRLALEHRPPLLHLDEFETQGRGDRRRWIAPLSHAAQQLDAAQRAEDLRRHDPRLRPIRSRHIRRHPTLSTPTRTIVRTVACIYTLPQGRSVMTNSTEAATGSRSETPRIDGAPCTCFKLRRAARRVTQVYDRHLQPTGLRITQFGLLARLRGGPLGMTQLAERMGMDRTT